MTTLFQSRHYRAIAGTIKESMREKPGLVPGTPEYGAWLDVAEMFASMFAADNGHFQRERFLEACGFGV